MKSELRIYLITGDEEAREVFSGLGNGTVCETSPGVSPEEALAAMPAGVHVLAVELDEGEEQLKLLEEWTAANPGIPAYVITGSSNLDDVRHYMRSGARDVFVKPLDKSEIMKEMEQVMSEAEALEEGAKLVSFMDVKGGNGCTTVAVNTAIEIARQGELKTLFMDLDLQFGDAAAQIDLASASTVMEALSQASRLDASLLGSLVTETESGLHVLASPDRLLEMDSVKASDIRKLLETAMELYDVVLVDLPRVITGWVSEVLRWSDHIFLVAQGSVSDVRDATILAEHLANIGANQEGIHFIHNRSGVKHATVDSEQLAKSLKTDRLITIRNDYDTAIHASDLGKSIHEFAKGSKLAKDIEALAGLVVEMCGHKADKKEAGVFSRFFKKHGEG